MIDTFDKWGKCIKVGLNEIAVVLDSLPWAANKINELPYCKLLDGKINKFLVDKSSQWIIVMLPNVSFLTRIRKNKSTARTLFHGCVFYFFFVTGHYCHRSLTHDRMTENGIIEHLHMLSIAYIIIRQQTRNQLKRHPKCLLQLYTANGNNQYSNW